FVFFQAEDGIRDATVTGVQTCALPISAMLKTEVSGWPRISTKPMFGMMGLYRGKKIFGGLPVTRGFDTPNSVIFRFDPMPQDLLQRVLKDSRITPGKRWFSFEVASTSDLRSEEHTSELQSR